MRVKLLSSDFYLIKIEIMLKQCFNCKKWKGISRGRNFIILKGNCLLHLKETWRDETCDKFDSKVKLLETGEIR